MSTSKRILAAGDPVVILEIANDAFKIMVARGVRGQVVVEDLCLQQVSGGGVALLEAISAATKGMDLRRHRVIGCIPRQAVNVRTLELPSMDPDEISDMVDFQVAKQTPYTKEEIFSDYRILGSDREGYTKVMLVIVQRSALRQYFYLLDELKIDVEWMAVSTEGILNWFRGTEFAKESGKKAIGILDVDTLYSDFMVVTGRNLVFTRCVRIGAGRLAENPQAAWSELAQELRPLLETCRTEHPGLTLERLLLTGAGARIAGLKDHLGPALNFPVATVDELQTVKKLPADLSAGDAIFQSMSVTSLIGMTVAPEGLQVNLMPDSIRLRHDLLAKAGGLGAVGASVMALMISVSLFSVVKFYLGREERGAVRAQVEALEPARKNVEKMSEICTVVRKYRNPRFAMVNVLAALHPLVPADVNLDALEIDEGKGRVTLTGTGGSIKDVRSLINGLENSPLFADAKEDGVNKEPRTGRFKFKIGCALERPK